MNRLQAAVLGVALGSVVLPWPGAPASAAGKYDGSKPMLCAITAMSECTADGKCERSVPQAGNNLPTFVRVDVKGGLLTDNDGSGRDFGAVVDARDLSIADHYGGLGDQLGSVKYSDIANDERIGRAFCANRDRQEQL